MLIITEPKILHEIINSQNQAKFMEENVVFNLSANKAIGIPLRILPPQQALPMINTDRFDAEYASYLLANNDIFMQFFQIPLALYNGKNAMILTYREPDIFDPISEVVVKLIQQRYGYNYNLISSLYDYNEAEESGFTTLGIQEFDRDLQRYISLVSMYNPEAFTKEVIHDEHL